MEEKNTGNLIKNILVVILVIVMFSALGYIFLRQKDNNNGVSVSVGEGTNNKNNEEVEKQAKKIAEVLKLVNTRFIEDIDIEKLGLSAINAILNETGDIYTYYMSKEEYDELLTAGTKEYVGVGIHTIFDASKNAGVIFGVMPDTPADKAGIKSGDVLLEVEGVVVTKETYQQCLNSIRGEEGTVVNIKLKRKEEIMDKKITRTKVMVNNVESSMLKDNIGYIRIIQFEMGVADSFKKEYDKLINAGAKGLVLDLRNNPGGILDETVKIADLLIKDGVIVETISKDGTKVTRSAKNSDEINIPLTVLINERSASASEILAGAIKDHGKGVLIGEKTYGKGIVQRIEELSDGSAISITSSKYYTKSGVEIHKKGIEPDIKVELTDEEKGNIFFDLEANKQFKTAIEEIKKKW